MPCPHPAREYGPLVRASRGCSRSGCTGPAVATLTYVYSDSTAVLGPLAVYAEPHCYDLCAPHAQRLTVPRGWEVVRLEPDLLDAEHVSSMPGDDLLAVADAVREPARPPAPRADAGADVLVGKGTASASGVRTSPVPGDREGAAVEVGRRGHLRVLQDPGGV
ncbi:MAG: DUF3499 domain-containing protein [Actinomycetes bacterium]